MEASEKLIVEGQSMLSGEVEVSAAKNSVLKLMAAALLCNGPVTIRNVPDIYDTRVMLQLIEKLGCSYGFNNKDLTLIPDVKDYEADYSLVNKMRASILVLGPLVARYGYARVALPGGCNIGHRKIDLHLKGLAQLGAEVSTERGFIEVRCNRLKGAHIYLDFPSVGATENLVMAAVLAEGETVIENAAREPEIVDLIHFLRKAGADIEGEGTTVVKVRGVKELKGVEHTPIPDRIEAGTFVVAGLITNSRIKIKNVRPDHLQFFLDKMQEAGARFRLKKNEIEVLPSGRLRGIDIATFPYPGFPTDLQPQTMALLCLADGVSVITENIFDNRFLHADELIRMGADISISEKHAIVRGVEQLYGVPVRALDLRGGAALVVAALAAQGKSEIYDPYHIYRGYEDFDEKLRKLGARVERVMC